jgi:creatinine amidohydrolase/Fe(II)-dependent formamide hydrolase-like protein
MVQHPEIKVGVMGSFEGASAELGKKIAEECADSLAEMVMQLEENK